MIVTFCYLYSTQHAYDDQQKCKFETWEKRSECLLFPKIFGLVLFNLENCFGHNYKT